MTTLRAIITHWQLMLSTLFSLLSSLNLSFYSVDYVVDQREDGAWLQKLLFSDFSTAAWAFLSKRAIVGLKAVGAE